MSEIRFDLHAARYGEIVTADLPGAIYHERQCSACPHEHRCCDLVVMATPAEAAGILQWLARNARDVGTIARAVQFRASVLGEHFKKFKRDQAAAIADWYNRRIKCVFYDPDTRRCSIYPVRPVACRRAFGEGDCKDGAGIKAALDTAEVLTARVSRYKIHPDPQQNVAELTSLVSHMATHQGPHYIDEPFYLRNPAELSDDQVIYGLTGAPIRNPVALETNHGRP